MKRKEKGKEGKEAQAEKPVLFFSHKG